MNISQKIEHTLLNADSTERAIKLLAEDALKYQLSGVCIPPYFVRDLFRHTEGSGLKIITVSGFPLGYNATVVKNEELKRALDEGASDVDVVVNLAAVKSGDWTYVGSEVETLTRSAHLKGKVIKLILETGLINDEELNRLIDLGLSSGVDFFKTSTGYPGVPGATPEIIAKLRAKIGSEALIKASGGIRTREQALALIDAGADLIGTSHSLEIIK